MRTTDIRYRISFIIKIIATFLLLSVVCISSPELPVGEVAGQWYWLSRMGILYSICMLVALLLGPDRKKTIHPEYYHIVIWSLIVLGGIQSLWGLRQIYIYFQSVDSPLMLTGSFFNRGLYAGYLAMVFPLCLNQWLISRDKRKKSFIDKLGYITTFAIMLMILFLLPITLSFTSWVAVTSASVFIIWKHFHLRKIWENNRKKLVYASFFIVLCLIIAGAIFYNAEKKLVQERFFVWKITLNTIAQEPITGYGKGGFPVAYGTIQEAYFAAGNFDAIEENVAINPNYPFNEYFHIAIEWGIPILICILLFVFLAIYEGIKKDRISATAAIISLLIFAFSNFPIQIPAFIITFLFLLIICIIGRERFWLMGITLLIGSFSVHWWYMDDYRECREWSEYQRMYHTAAFNGAEEGYQVLYPVLKTRTAFLYEYGDILYKIGKYDESIEVLLEATKICADPMVFNVIGKNYQMKGDYSKAEEWYKRSLNILPAKVYPYYLLAKLYSNPDYYYPEKRDKMIKMALTKEPDVQITSIRQIRQEIKKMAEGCLETY